MKKTNGQGIVMLTEALYCLDDLHIYRLTFEREIYSRLINLDRYGINAPWN